MNADQLSFQFTSNAKFQIPKPAETVIHASATAETTAGTIAEPTDQVTKMLDSASEQPSLDLHAGRELPQQYIRQGEDPVLTQSSTLFAADIQDMDMENTAGHESDDSSEIPEIVVDLDDSDSDDTDDDNSEVL